MFFPSATTSSHLVNSKQNPRSEDAYVIATWQ